MLSKIERDYIGDPDSFERRNNDNYVRKIRNNIRKKVGISIEEISKIIQFSETDFDKNNSNVGRIRKSIVPNGSIDVLRDSLKWFDAEENKRLEIESSLNENIQRSMRSVFEDTKIGKELYK